MIARPQRIGAVPALDSSLGFRLSRLARRLRRTWADTLAPLELSPPQAAVLRGVAASPGSSLRALARHLDADPMNAKRCVDALEARGLLESGHDPGDHRPRTLVVTPAGAAVAREVERLAAAQDAQLEEALPGDVASAIYDALGRLETLLGPDRPEADHGATAPEWSGRARRTRGAGAAANPATGGAR